MSGFSNITCLHCGASMPDDDERCPACGEVQLIPDESPEAWVGRTIDGKYELITILGVGGMGMVFEAERALVGDRIALKVLFPRLLESPLQRRLFDDEAIVAARLSHPNVVTVFDAEFSAAERTAYIAMELLEGRTLKKLLREAAPMSPDVILPIAIEICSALAAAHSAQVIHRDLKPDNVFLQARGEGYRVKLVDFGIAAMLDADRPEERRQRLGTLRYMAPEQCRCGPVDGRADLYALGVLLYEGLTRRRATGKTITSVLEEIPKPLNHRLPADAQLSPRLEGLVMALLAKDPGDRPPDADTLRGELERALAEYLGEPIIDPPPSTGPLLPKRLWLPLLLAVGAGVAAGLVWGLLR
jgi:serine/threonine protein kinase